jgi:hypothetical protein
MEGRQALLSGIGLVGSLPAALLPWLLAARIAPIYASAGAQLPGLTLIWMRWWPLSLLLPVLVGLLWRRLAGHPQRGARTAMASALGALLVDGFSVVALWLPLLRMPDLAA